MSELFPQSAGELRARLQVALEACVQSGRISERERRVVAMRLAITDGRWHTLAATGAAIGDVGKERARQIQNRAIWKLRHCAEIHDLLQAYLRLVPPPRTFHRRPPWLASNRLLQAMPSEQGVEEGRGE